MNLLRILPVFALVASTACTSMNASHDTQASAGTAPSAAVRAKPAPVFPYTIERHALDNGVQVRLIPMPSGGLVSYWTIVRTGSRDEVEQGVTGFAHFFEHMMFRGSKRFPDFDKIVNGIGADSNAYTTDDYTAYHLGFAREDLNTVIEVEADRFQNLDYSVDQFKTESGAVYGEYRKGRTSPFDVLFESVQNAAFDQHTYKHTTIGFEADIKRMPEQYDYSKSFFQRFYRPENVVIVVAGDFDTKAALAKIQKEYAGWKKGYTAPAVPKEPAQTAQRRLTVEFEGQTLPMLAVNWKGDALKPTDKTMMAATLFGELAFGETSAIYKKLVLDEQKVETLFASFGYNRDPGLWSVIAMVKDPKDVASVEAEIWKTVEKLQKEPVNAQRLADVRSRLKYGFLTGLSTPNGVCSSLAQLVAITGDLNCVEEMDKTLEQVTPFDVQSAASLYLKPERSTVALLHTKGQAVPSFSTLAPNAQPALAALAPSGARFAFADAATPTLPAAPAEFAPESLAQKPVLLPVAQDPNVAFKLWFQVGAQDDPPGKEGLAALTAAMITEAGTASREYQAILEALFPLAAGYGNSVDKEMTIVSGLAHRDVADRFAELFLDAVVHPGFRESDFTRLRDQMVSGIENELRYSSDEELGKATLVQSVFAGTRYAHIDEGTVASLKALTVDDVKAFYASHFTRDNVVMGLGGAYSKELQQKVERALLSLPAGKPAPVAKPAVARPSGRHVTLVEKDGPSTAISFGYPIDVKRGSREFYALWIANSWLGEHRNSVSHLYQVIREARGMNYGDYSYIEAYTNGGRRNTPPAGVARRQQMFEVWVRPVPRDQALFALRAALREVDKLAKNGLTKEQFDYQRKFLKNYCLHFAETTSDRLGWALDDRFYGTEANGGHLATFRKMMDEITLDEVNAAVKKHLQADDLEIALVTAGAKELAEKIVADAPSPITYPAGVTKPAEILEEDHVIQAFPLKVPAENVRIVPVDQMFAGTKANG
ncbi:MAG: pitrilysin family protein [Planctomycetota bacterium]